MAEQLERHSQGVRNPRWMPWRSLKGAALAVLGRREEAIALVEDEVAIAREWGTPSGLGHSLRVLGELRGPDGFEELEEAAALLERSDQRIERARAFAALGAEVRRARRPPTPASRYGGRSSWLSRQGLPRWPKTCDLSCTPPGRGLARPPWTAWSRSPSATCAWPRSRPAARPIATSLGRFT
jgi:hypothetical protein